MRKSYVYLLHDPTDYYAPFYVGKGSGKRYMHHARPSARRIDKNQLKLDKLDSIRLSGLKPAITIWEDNLSDEDAFALEKMLIGRFGRLDLRTGILTNKISGGDGCSSIIWDYGQRQRQRERVTGTKNPMFGKTHDILARERISELRKNRTTQYRHTDDHKLKLKTNNAGGKSVSRTVCQYDTQWNLVKIWPSLQKAANELGCSKGNIWTAVNTKKNNKIAGFYWRYENDQ